MGQEEAVIKRWHLGYSKIGSLLLKNKGRLKSRYYEATDEYVWLSLKHSKLMKCVMHATAHYNIRHMNGSIVLKTYLIVL